MLLRMTRKLMITLFLVLLIYSVIIPSAEAFKLTVTNQDNQARSFSILYYDENADNFLCVGWYNVPAQETKAFSFPKSKNLPYAYAYSKVWHDGDNNDKIELVVTNQKFSYYQNEPFPQGSHSYKATFSKFDINNGNAEIVLGGDDKTAPVQMVSAGLGDKIVNLAKQMRGKPYVWGGSVPETGFDCSGLTYYILGQLGKDIERTADIQYHREESIGIRELRPGDLIFFAWHHEPDPEHVGIYIGNKQFIHAANNPGTSGPTAIGTVKVENFDQWYQSNFIGGRRFY